MNYDSLRKHRLNLKCKKLCCIKACIRRLTNSHFFFSFRLSIQMSSPPPTLTEAAQDKSTEESNSLLDLDKNEE